MIGARDYNDGHIWTDIINDGKSFRLTYAVGITIWYLIQHPNEPVISGSKRGAKPEPYGYIPQWFCVA